MKILITGTAGTGKTSVIDELKKRGYIAFDIDSVGVCAWFNTDTGKKAEYGYGQSTKWLEKHEWKCEPKAVKEYLNENFSKQMEDVFVSGIVANLEDIVHLFDKIFVLEVEDDEQRKRLTNRTTNHFARYKDEQDKVLADKKYFREKYSTFNPIILNTTEETVEETADRILKLINEK